MIGLPPERNYQLWFGCSVTAHILSWVKSSWMGGQLWSQTTTAGEEQHVREDKDEAFFNDQMKACLWIRKSSTWAGRANAWPATSVPDNLLACHTEGLTLHVILSADEPEDKGSRTGIHRASVFLSFILMSHRWFHSPKRSSMLPGVALQVNHGIESRFVKDLMALALSSGQSVPHTSLHYHLTSFIYISNTFQIGIIFHNFFPNCGV